MLDASTWTGQGLISRRYREEAATTRFDSPATWLRSFNAKVRTFLELLDDWNSYGGKRPTQEAARDAWALAQLAASLGAPEPSVVPTASGGIQLEWHVPGTDLEVECVGGGTHVVVFDDEASGNSWDAELDYGDLARLTEALRLFRSVR
jgi:hypothetical protein